jgi:hypothetical protein
MLNQSNIAPALERWQRLTKQLAGPHVELTIEEFSPIAATYNQLRRAGVQMDPMLAALMRVLIRQTYYTDDDPDNDAGSDCEMSSRSLLI